MQFVLLCSTFTTNLQLKFIEVSANKELRIIKIEKQRNQSLYTSCEEVVHSHTTNYTQTHTYTTTSAECIDS